MRIFLFILFIGFQSYSQNCNQSITGRVVDFHDGSPLSGAVLIIAGHEIFTQTDLDGNFQFDNLCEGNYTLQVSHPECDTKATQFTIPFDGSLNIRLE
uniref:carboxypeptidase-like regulatory domain-containing protein n=1 Tax=uncultured Planktosalinus sp. TaxID=1810935 RepID=UPI0030DC7F05